MTQHSSFSTSSNARLRQSNFYLQGISGYKPDVPVDLNALEEVAKKKLSLKAYNYIAGGAGVGRTIQNNRSDFSNFRIHPRMLRDVSALDSSIELFGDKLPSPLLTSPVGALDMIDKEADLKIARATSKLGIPMIFSNQAGHSMEAMAAQMGNSPRWFQLYWSKRNDLVASLVSRAEACGCSAITVTLDTTMLGWRIQDLQLAYLPFSRGLGIAQYTSDPVFQKILDEPEDINAIKIKPKITFQTLGSVYQMKANYPGGFWKNLTSQRPLKAIQKFTAIYSRPSLTWDDLAFLREHTSLPIILKGILHPEDAKKAIDYGIDGILVSNHGGRQVDGSISSIMALPAVVDAVQEQIPVLLDSGVRSGADLFKAIALGAKAVCIGRPFAYGLAIAGERGVSEVLQNLRSDFELNMGLAGCKNVGEIRREMLSS